MAQLPQKNLGAELIAQLRAANTPLARIRLAARAWRVLRTLTPQDRLQVATQIGLDGADDLVEALAAHQGTTPPAELMKAVNQIQTIDPATVKTLTAKMRDPRQRGQVIGQGLKALESALTGAGAKPPAARPAAPPPPGTPPVVVKPATSWPLREAPAQSLPAAPPAQPPAKLSSPTAPAAASVPAPAPVASPAPGAASVPVAPSPPPAAMAPVVVATPTPARPIHVPAVVVKPTEPPRETGPPTLGELAGRLAMHALTARFRLLRRRMEETRRLSPSDLRGILEAFPDGWARRRALLELIAAGVPERSADALSLIDTLQSPGDRSWCLGALADRRALSAEEQNAILQAAPNPAGRRRLELRLDSGHR